MQDDETNAVHGNAKVNGEHNSVSESKGEVDNKSPSNLESKPIQNGKEDH